METGLLEKLKLPLIVKNKLLIHEGEWNGVVYSGEELKDRVFSEVKNIKTLLRDESASVDDKLRYRNMTSLFLDHEDGTKTWIGDITNFKWDEDKKGIRGDLNIVDEDTARSIQYQLDRGYSSFGISPRFLIQKDGKDAKNVRVKSWSLVLEPAQEENTMLSMGEEREEVPLIFEDVFETTEKEEETMSKEKKKEKDVKLEDEEKKEEKKKEEKEEKLEEKSEEKVEEKDKEEKKESLNLEEEEKLPTSEVKNAATLDGIAKGIEALTGIVQKLVDKISKYPSPEKASKQESLEGEDEEKKEEAKAEETKEEEKKEEEKKEDSDEKMNKKLEKMVDKKLAKMEEDKKAKLIRSKGVGEDDKEDSKEVTDLRKKLNDEKDPEKKLDIFLDTTYGDNN